VGIVASMACENGPGLVSLNADYLFQ